MAVAFDASANSGALTSASSATYAHTCTGSNLVLVVGANARVAQPSTNNVVTGITYNTVALTKIRADTNNATSPDTFSGRSELWYLVNPATGAHNVVVTWTGSTTYAGSGSASFTGAVQGAGAIDSSNGTTGTALTITQSTTVVASGCYIIDSVYSRSGTLTKDATQTLIAGITISADDNVGFSYKVSPGTGSQSMTWTESNDGNDWAITLFSLAPAAAAAAVTGRTFMTTNTGFFGS